MSQTESTEITERKQGVAKTFDGAVHFGLANKPKVD
jgi:hypothetical protein